jgi:hypothetical protein
MASSDNGDAGDPPPVERKGERTSGQGPRDKVIGRKTAWTP